MMVFQKGAWKKNRGKVQITVDNNSDSLLNKVLYNDF